MTPIEITSELTLLSGLHIGGSEDGMKIGGVDSPVIKREVFSNSEGEIGFGEGFNKITEPYIPGSSLKGKIRSLLEHYFKLVDPLGDGKVIDSETDFKGMDKQKRDLIVKLFGESSGNDKTPNKINITRAVFRDCYITEIIRKEFLAKNIELFETKHENVIDRKTGTTVKGGLREIERVQSSVRFDFNLTIRIFEKSERELLKNTLLLGMKLLELDTLGGSGSRGYGRVRFEAFKNEELSQIIQRIDDELNKS